jgi:hypothetical protein
MRIRSPIAVWVSVFAVSVSLLVFAGCGGCAAGKGQLDPKTGIYSPDVAADTVVVTAEKLRETALIVFDAAMKAERDNEAALKAIDPKIHEAIELIRREGKGWLNDLTAAKVAYQSARTPENANKLQSAMAAVTSALASASRHLATAATRKAP